MSGHTATTLAFVRTSAGVVQVDPEGTIPDDVEETELQRLVDGGVAVEAKPKPAPPTGQNVPSGDKGSSRGRNS